MIIGSEIYGIGKRGCKRWNGSLDRRYEKLRKRRLGTLVDTKGFNHGILLGLPNYELRKCCG